MTWLRAASGPEVAEQAVNACENAEVNVMLVHTIDSVFQDIQRLFHGGDIPAADFREYRHRLWVRREAVAEELLPPGQRQRVSAGRLD